MATTTSTEAVFDTSRPTRSLWSDALRRLMRNKMAVASVADYRVCPRLDAPATPERVLMAVERLTGM